MKILVLSDSHGARGLMRMAVEAVKPDAVIHLGDYYDDGEILSEAYPHIPFHLVAGNCDRNRMPQMPLQTLCYDVCGVLLYMTHGHCQCVKSGTQRLAADAEQYGAKAALYGHTHQPECCLLESGMWLLNPGSCGSYGGSVGLIETEGNTIHSCQILRQEDLEAFV